MSNQDLPPPPPLSLDINECITGTYVCEDGNSDCNNTIGGYECVCNDGYEAINGSCIGIATNTQRTK